MGSLLSWEDFVRDNLLKMNVLDSIMLITKYGELIYSWGGILDNQQCLQFKDIFNTISEKQENDVCRKGFTLTKEDNVKIHYKVYKKTLSSVYGMSEKRRSGLIICNLPYGILITTYSGSTDKARDVIKLVEDACTLLRS